MMFPFSRWDLLVLWRVTMKLRWFGRSMWQRTSNWQVSRAFATWCSFVSASCVRHDFVVMLRNIYYVPRGGFSRSLPFCVHIMLHCCELAQSSWQMSSLLRCEKVSFRGSMPTFQFWLRGKKRHQFSGADERAKGETLEMGDGWGWAGVICVAQWCQRVGKKGWNMLITVILNDFIRILFDLSLTSLYVFGWWRIMIYFTLFLADVHGSWLIENSNQRCFCECA